MSATTNPRKRTVRSTSDSVSWLISASLAGFPIRIRGRASKRARDTAADQDARANVNDAR